MSLLEIKEEIERLGGIFPVPVDNPFPTLSQQEITQLEDRFGKSLPEDYRDFLLEFGGCSFEQYALFSPKKVQAEFQPPEDIDYVNTIIEGSLMAHFYGSDKGDDPLLQAYDIYKDRIPNLCLPIASDCFESQIIMSLEDGTWGNIYWWDREHEWDSKAYEEAHGGEKMPELYKWQNVFFICSGLTQFFKDLFLDE